MNYINTARLVVVALAPWCTKMWGQGPSAGELLFAPPSISDTLRLGMTYGEAKKVYPALNTSGLGGNNHLLVFVTSLKAEPWNGAAFSFRSDKVEAIPDNELPLEEIILIEAEVQDVDAPGALKRILTAAVQRYGKPKEIKVYKGDRHALLSPVFVWPQKDAVIYLGAPNLVELTGRGANGIQLSLTAKDRPLSQILQLPSPREIEMALVEKLLPRELFQLIQ
jgi:hypothetical protein